MTVTRSVICLGCICVLIAMNSATAKVEGFGKDVPLSHATLLFPLENFSIEFAEDVDKSITISWSSADDWKTELNRALGEQGLIAAFGTETVIITKAPDYRKSPISKEDAISKIIEKNGTTKPTKKSGSDGKEKRYVRKGFSLVPYKGETDPVKAIVQSSQSVSISEKSNPANEQASKVYHAKAGRTLRETLREWVDMDSWKLVWLSKHDYILDADAKFEGDIISATSEIVKAMSMVHPQPLVDIFTENKAMVVSNNVADISN